MPSHAVAAAPPTSYIVPVTSRPKLTHAVFGLLYLLTSLSIGLSYLSLLAPSLLNDLWWAGFSPTEGGAFLIDIVNAQLALVNATSLDIYAIDAAIKKRYNASSATTNLSPTYARRILFAELTSIEYAVPQLRTLSASWAMRMNVQYCYVDFDQNFEVAHTARRQRRCRRQYATNGAVYLEAIWRNVVWADYITTWGGDGGRFSVAYQRGLQETLVGRNFLANVAHARNSTTMDDELNYWRQFRINRFQLQWQNRWQPGVTETILLENAIGLQQLVTIKDVSQGVGSWSSGLLFWIPLNDLRFAQAVNRSLIRSASNFFGANVSSTLPFEDLEVFQGNTLVSGQFFNQSALFRDTIGPFQSVDSLYVDAPSVLVQAVHRAKIQVSNELLDVIPSVTLRLTPLAWRGFVYHGGNLLCTTLPGTTFVQQSFDFFDDCSKPKPLIVTWSSLAAVFTRLATLNASVHDICEAASSPTDCAAAVTATDQLLQQQLATPFDWTPPTIDLDVHLMQYATTSNGSWVVLRQHLLEPSFAFFGWVLLYDWVLGEREVISFQGDSGTLTLISNVYAPLSYTTGTQPLQTATQLLYYLVVLTSILLVTVGGLVLLYAITARGRFNGVNLFFFNRIAGTVWLGRPLLFLRGASALVLLSSANASLTTAASGWTRFEPSPRSWLAALIVTGEATWVTYVANDVVGLQAHDHTRYYSALSCHVSWLVLFALEMVSPVQVTGALHRSCVGLDMDFGVRCASGLIFTGSISRIGAIAVIQAIALVLYGVALLQTRKHTFNDGYEAPLLLHGSARRLLTPAPDTTQTLYVLDHVACVLAGLLPLRLAGKACTFDIKLWLLLYDDSSTSGRHKALPRPIFTPEKPVDGPRLPLAMVAQTLSACTTRACKALGLGYALASIAGSVSYLSVSRVNLANDILWATFNATGAHAFVANWLNEQLVLGNTNMANVLLDLPSINAMGSFANPTALIASPGNYGAYLQHTLLSSIETIIDGLRRSKGCDAPWIFSPYCYLDLQRQWTMANSATRQARCDARMTTNGAVYFETVLRNVDYTSFHRCWGSSFDIAIGTELQQSSNGRAWLQMVSGLKPSTRDEAIYWRSFGLKTFETQWQNYKQLGIRNSYSVINALGVEYALTLASQRGTYRLGSQTTFKMYWSLANDLAAVASNASGIGGRSLLRSSANYAFANTSLASVYVTTDILASPLPQGLQLSTNRLGPFGSIDLVYVPPPEGLRQLTASLLERTRAPLSGNLSAQATFFNITPLDLSRPVPALWRLSKLVAFGGSPLCPEGSASQSLVPITAGLISALSFDGLCLTTSANVVKIQPTRAQYIVGAVLSQLAPSTDVSPLCAHDLAFTRQCHAYLAATLAYIHTYMQLPPSVDVDRLTEELAAKDIALMMYARTDANPATPLRLYTTTLFDEPSFRFFAWLFLYDWVVGVREVVSFHGDTSTLTLLSDMETPLSQPTQAWEVPDNIARYLHVGVLYVTGVMISVSSLTIVYMALTRGSFEGLNMLELGRVGGIVWVGRPFLLLRSMTAIVVLSTATLQLQSTGYMSFFATVRDPWYKTLLAANEVTWLITIVNDVLLVATGPYATRYALLNAGIVWLIAALLTLWSPVTATLSVDLQCHFETVDFQINCTSGSIVIGSVSRVALLIGVVLISHGVCYVFVKSCLPPPCSTMTSSLFLTSGAKYLFAQSNWMHNNVYYVDRASAALDGLLTLRWGSSMIVLDVKTWRLFAIPLDAIPPRALAAALPLRR
ncbi:hypothetical protein SDRG_07046 [Saprolegnia diclina VS20]|uniref:Uncharacterized protein n=1 Tax=Saprolegnia diclina (strain VS20) TaxID=1156394 RepID=T0QBP8_SAPDV|nr:hypothetical protein SDRG_07046 [Saprolegnia diclina VS20]EQC35334.1 hypothetical protein SDRG_07046 [Saprolegnia diclina VS20]|eukprot:XP_008611084.1 hypothetical protein SDRG_07046 [Saprolegnia diclina VS20]